MKKIYFLGCLCIMFFQSTAQINLDEVLYSRISSTERLMQRQEEELRLIGGVGRSIKYARIKSIEYTIDSGEATILTDSLIFLPEQYIINYYSNQNCSDDRRGWQQVLTLKVSEGQTIRITNSVKSSKRVSYSLGFKIPIPSITGADLSGSTSSDMTFETSEVQEVQQTNTREETVSKTIDFEVDPKKILYVSFKTTKYTLRVPFEATLQVNGIVVVQNVQRLELLGSIDEAIIEEGIPISSMLDIDQRTFSISGFLENSKAGKEEIEYAEANLPVDSCGQIPQINPFVALNEKIEAKKKLTTRDVEMIQNSGNFIIREDLGEGKMEDGKMVESEKLNFKKINL